MNFRALWLMTLLVFVVVAGSYSLRSRATVQISASGPDLIVPVLPQYQIPKRTSGTLGLAAGHCSATMFNHHALLTAGHCTNDNPEIVRFMGETGHVLKIVDDGADHALMVTDFEFTAWASFGLPMQVGDEIFIFGSPGGYDTLLRKGYVAGSSGPYLILDLNGFWGDSGSAIFNSQGQVVGMLTEIRNDSRDLDGNPTSMKFMAATPFRFTPAQLALVQ